MSHHYSGPDFGFPRGDARLDLTDLYAFSKPGDARKSILIMNVHPSFSLQPRGPTRSDPFAHEAIYELKIDTNRDAVADIAYRVRFSPYENGAQSATVRRIEGKTFRVNLEQPGVVDLAMLEHRGVRLQQDVDGRDRSLFGGERYLAAWKQFLEGTAPRSSC